MLSILRSLITFDNSLLLVLVCTIVSIVYSLSKSLQSHRIIGPSRQDITIRNLEMLLIPTRVTFGPRSPNSRKLVFLFRSGQCVS